MRASFELIAAESRDPPTRQRRRHRPAGRRARRPDGASWLESQTPDTRLARRPARPARSAARWPRSTPTPRTVEPGVARGGWLGCPAPGSRLASPTWCGEPAMGYVAVLADGPRGPAGRSSASCRWHGSPSGSATSPRRPSTGPSDARTGCRPGVRAARADVLRGSICLRDVSRGGPSRSIRNRRCGRIVAVS